MVKSDAAKQRRNRVIRWSVLGLILVWVTVMGYLHQNPVFGWTPPGVDALFPFGALEGLLSWVASGQILPKLAAR